MNEEEIIKLLDKYYSGNTSQDEEKELKKYFSDDDVLHDIETEKGIFSGLAKFDEVPEPSAGFEDRIIKSIDELERRQGRNNFRNKYIALFSAAAAILLLFGSYFIFIYKAQLQDTFSDPQIAYVETMKILNDISVKLNKGTQALQPINKIESAARLSKETIDRSASIISGSLKKIKPVSQLSDIEFNRNDKKNN